MIYFVGIHNKEGMKPLDSRTISGRIIDYIIIQSGKECKKLNLFDFTGIHGYTRSDLDKMTDDFIIKVDVNGLYILLGAEVNKWIDGRIKNSISVKHPAYAARKGKDGINNYCQEIIKILVCSYA